MELRDLPPRNNPKGGSPKSPLPIPVSEFNPHPPRIINGNFWGGIAKHFVSFLCGALAAAFFVGGKSRDVSDLLQWKGETSATLRDMNDKGTNYSRLQLATEEGQIQSNINRINDLDKKVEPIGAMQAKIEGLQRQIDAKK